MALTKEDIKQLAEEVGPKMTAELKGHFDAFESQLNEKYKLVKEGLIEKGEFENFKTTGLKDINEKLAGLEDVNKKQGEKINELTEATKKKSRITVEDVLKSNMDAIKTMYKNQQGNHIINLKEAGVITIGNIAPMDVPPGSPYAPGIDSTALEFFDIIQNQNYALSRVDLGRTTQSRLAWINEVGGEGLPTEVAEGAPKPLLDVDFKVELSVAVKLAAMMEITDEFEKDVPYLATLVRRLFREKILRGFDNAVYAALIAAATGYTITGLDDKIQAANLWDSIYSGMTQIEVNNFMANLIGLNPITNARVKMQKDGEDRYLVPPFAGEIERLLAKSNKVAEDFAIIGDASQFKVDIYEDFVLKVGWNMNNFRENKFSVVGEIRYHKYISDNRKKALAYFDVDTVAAQIAEPAA